MSDVTVEQLGTRHIEGLLASYSSASRFTTKERLRSKAERSEKEWEKSHTNVHHYVLVRATAVYCGLFSFVRTGNNELKLTLDVQAGESDSIITRSIMCIIECAAQLYPGHSIVCFQRAGSPLVPLLEGCSFRINDGMPQTC
jgi:hypothetical protein